MSSSTRSPASPVAWEEIELDLPSGGMRVVVTTDGQAVTGLRFGPAAAHAAWLAGTGERSPGTFLDDAVAQLEAYAAGRLTEFDLPLRLEGTAFQAAVWSALRKVPYGHTVSYGWLAAEVGRPGSARAVGAAVGANPIGIVVPCHRVVGARGELTGFAGGLDNKIKLLAREGVTAL